MRVKGQWRHLYQAVDSTGATLEFLLSAKQAAEAARRFVSKALGRQDHPEPRVIHTDGHGAYPPAIAQLKEEGTLAENGRQVREEAGQVFRHFAHYSGAQIFTSPESMIFRSRVRTGRLNALAVATITRSAGSR